MDKYLRLLIQLLPSGLAWAKKQGSNLYKLLDEGIAPEFRRIQERIEQFIKEMDPRNAFELLVEWESMLGLPDHCLASEDATLDQRRNQIVQRLTDRGEMTEAYYEQIAQNLGYDVDVQVYAAQKFKVGISRVGDSLTNDPWEFIIIVTVPIGSDVKFRVGKSTVGEPLRDVENELLQCVLRDRKPAHSDMFFIFE